MSPAQQPPAPRAPHVSALMRYPVKSMAGEGLDVVDITPRGLAGDREWGVYTADGGIGSGKTTRRFRRIEHLLDFRAGGDPVVVHGPDGHTWDAGSAEGDAALSARLGQPLELRQETTVRHHDEAAVHIVTASGIAAVSAAVGTRLDWRRFRPNLVLDDTTWDDHETGDDVWLGRDVRVGDVVLRVTGLMPRCVMVGMTQSGLDDGLGDDSRILRALRPSPDLGFGLKAEVMRAGRVRVGDVARLH